MRFIYTYRELWRYGRNAAGSLFTGLFRIVWTIVLLVANLAIWGVSGLVRAIRKAPVTAFFIMLGCMAVAVFATYAQMKTKLTTAEWQRDMLELRMDSIKVLYGDKVGYYRYQSYKEK